MIIYSIVMSHYEAMHTKVIRDGSHAEYLPCKVAIVYDMHAYLQLEPVIERNKAQRLMNH